MQANFQLTHPESTTAQLLQERFRCGDLPTFVVAGHLSPEPGYFRFGTDTICYGQCSSGAPAKSVMEPLYDACEHVETDGSSVQLPFDPVQVVDNLRGERYVANSRDGSTPLPANKALRNLYYTVRPAMGVLVRKHLHRLYFKAREKSPFPHWPVDVTIETLMAQLLVFAMKAQNVARLPFIWFWPYRMGSCTTIGHDVETDAGLRFVSQLMDLDDSFGIKTSFQIVPEKRYTITEELLRCIRERGFEINVHDLNHDGRLFRSREQFLRRAKLINQYAQLYEALGFRSAVMYRNTDWLDALEFSYDMSSPNVAHLDPQKGGCCTVFPFCVGKMIELPVTTTQDYSLFHILRDYSTRLWREQISRIRERHGLMNFIVHPDYIIEKSARRVYTELLELLCDLRSQGETWIASPGQVASWWRLRNQLNLVRRAGTWQIEGRGHERASLAYAVLDGSHLTYEFDSSTSRNSSGSIGPGGVDPFVRLS